MKRTCHIRFTPLAVRCRSHRVLAGIGWAIPALLAFVGITVSQPRVKAQETPPLRVGFSGHMFVEVNENDAAAAVRVWAQMLGREHDIPVDPTVKILRGTNEIAAALLAHNIDAITLTTDDYWTLRNQISFGSFIFGRKTGKLTEQYVLLVHRQSNVDRLADLRGRTLLSFRNPRASLAETWLETTLGQDGPASLTRFFSRVTPYSKLTHTILPVFFRQEDACLVTRQGFETASELNPQVGKQLKILASSEELVPVVFCFRDDYRSPIRERLVAEISHVNLSPAGRQFMTLFQCETLVERPESAMNPAFDLLTAHRELRAGHLSAETNRTHATSKESAQVRSTAQGAGL